MYRDYEDICVFDYDTRNVVIKIPTSNSYENLITYSCKSLYMSMPLHSPSNSIFRCLVLSSDEIWDSVCQLLRITETR